MFSHRKNVRTSKFWQKRKEKNQKKERVLSSSCINITNIENIHLNVRQKLF
jgi:hypothetical protein